LSLSSVYSCGFIVSVCII